MAQGAPVALPWWELQSRAHACLPRFLAEYVDGGAGAGAAIVRNRRDLEDILLVPQPLRAEEAVDPSLRLLDQDWAMPVALAPTGLNDLLHPHGDLELARAAARAALPFIQSSASLTPPGALAARGMPTSWQQIYVHDRHALGAVLAAHAAAGTEVLVVTVDVPLGGVRWHERRLPPSLRPSPAVALATLTRPAWLARHLWARFSGTIQYQQALPQMILDRRFDLRLSWEDLAQLRKRWEGKLLIKGLLSCDDAQRAQDIGCDGAILSNHGGRQLESAISAWAVLAAARAAVGKQFVLLADGGVRTGEDVVKAVALGADAVLIGRLALWALAAGGPTLLQATLQDLRLQICTAMQLSGCQSTGSICALDVRKDQAGPARHA
jgi:(S)-mandelate dehydrogenase